MLQIWSLRYVWIVDLAGAFLAMTWDFAVCRSGAAMPLNRVLVIANIAAAVVSVAFDTRWQRWTRDGWVVFAGASVFTTIL